MYIYFFSSKIYSTIYIHTKKNNLNKDNKQIKNPRKQQSKQFCFLSASILKVGNKVVSVLRLLKTTEGHLGTGNVLLGVLKVLEHGLLVPQDTLLLVGLSVSVTSSLTRESAENTVEVRTDLVGTTSLGSVALKTSSLEKVSTLLSVTWRKYCQQICFFML